MGLGLLVKVWKTISKWTKMPTCMAECPWRKNSASNWGITISHSQGRSVILLEAAPQQASWHGWQQGHVPRGSLEAQLESGCHSCSSQALLHHTNRGVRQSLFFPLDFPSALAITPGYLILLTQCPSSCCVKTLKHNKEKRKEIMD